MYLYEAILVRKSVKNYYMDQLDQTMLNNILNFANHLSMLFEGQQVQYKIVDYSNTDSKMLGIFSVKAPYYFVIGSDGSNQSLMNSGYLIQQISLYLTSKGIGSCLLGKKKLSKLTTEGLEYETGLVLAFGKAKDNVYRDSRKVKRLDEKELCIYKCEPDANLKALMKAARLSPSSMNLQPWRFVLYENRIHVFCKKDIFHGKSHEDVRNIDIGIVIAHLMIAAEELWIDATVKKLDNISNKYFKNNEYMISVILKV